MIYIYIIYIHIHIIYIYIIIIIHIRIDFHRISPSYPQLRCQEAAPEDLPRLGPGRRRARPAAPAGGRGDGLGSAEPLEASPGAQRRRPRR